MRTLRTSILAFITASASFAGAEPAKEIPLQSLPYTSGLDVNAMDRKADPCVDFYQYSCGGWMKNNPIPSDQASWSVYGKLSDENQRYLWGILQSLGNVAGKRSKLQQQLGDYFAACMDESTVDKLGKAPIEPMLKRIDAVKSMKDLPSVVAALHRDYMDGGVLFGFSSGQDFGDPSSVIAFASAGGLSLPDRDYYLKTDARSVELRKKFLTHVQRVAVLLGESPAAAKNIAQAVMRIETALAKASLSRVDRRDPHKLFHKMETAALQALTPRFDWSVYLAGIDHADPKTYNVTEPAFFQELDRQLAQRSVADWKAYLKWHLASEASPLLGKAFVDENFDFFARTLHGVPEQKPRWKRCVRFVDRQLGEALGQEFVSRVFNADLKARTLKMTQQIEEAMARDLDALTWMGPETKAKAREKLRTIVNKIGFPDRWRDYSSIEVRAGDFHGNVLRATHFESKRVLDKIGRPLDRAEWGMTPSMVNAMYDPQLNDITFPAGVLQPPLYDPKMDDAPNYGNTGGTIGHELTHGFDDEGRQFDATGQLKDWWTPADGKVFEERAQCIVDQYSKYVIVDDIKINSKLTEGEDIADLGGLVLAWMAWKAQHKDDKAPLRDDMTPEQRFFVGYAQWACENERPEHLRVSAVTNPHSPGKYRVNGLVVNMPEFEKAFQCKAGQPMVSPKRCRVW